MKLKRRTPRYALPLPEGGRVVLRPGDRVPPRLRGLVPAADLRFFTDVPARRAPTPPPPTPDPAA